MSGLESRSCGFVVALAAALVCVGCTESTGRPPPDQWFFGGERGVELKVPDAYDHDTPTPLLIVLHGYSASGLLQLVYSRLDTVINDHTVLVAAPDGTVDEAGNRFWNATDACCDKWNTGVDDLGYISGLITEISEVWNVDARRVYLFGHSNGSYMAYQMGCHHADKIAAFVGLAGAAQLDMADCAPGEAVSVLHIHGDQDPDVLYDGDQYSPSAATSVDYWSGYNGCGSSRVPDERRIDVDSAVDGAEGRLEYYEGCPPGIDVALWTLEGSGHVPNLRDQFATEVWSWLAAHPKP